MVDKVIDSLIDSPKEEKKDVVEANGEDKANMKRGPRLREDVQVKICDMGNGCWTYKHFTPEI
jgi:hypothetical protein